MGKLSENDIESILEKEPSKIIFLYRWLNQKSFIGKSSEALSEFLLDHFDIFDNIPELAYANKCSRSGSGWKYVDYRKNSRMGDPINPKPDPKMIKSGKRTREENYFAFEIFKKCRKENSLIPIENLGYILDYEMPIGGTKDLLKVRENCIYDENHKYGIEDPSEKDGLFKPGKCDLIAYDNNRFTILELKKETNEEPLIRAVMEAYTYLQMLDKKRATQSFIKHYRELDIPDYDETTWSASPLLFKTGSQYTEYIENENSNLRKLMKKMAIFPIWYQTEGSFSIVE